ncbi:12302_t:CDS:2 [Cetraspora pellucida]|uniref:12302_t:CDS:1 n=1 Tax=Cetraspora pellucida TaxID=1433469 RepID=A0A9N9HCW9_9GLOM|nr:12302_t:CDS:2 [Cetraspora pellucida]
MNIQNVTSTNSATSLSIPVSSAANNTTTTTSLTSLKSTLAVWEHFILLSNELKAKYKYCKSILVYKKDTGTSHLWHHLKSCNKFKRNGTCNEQSNGSNKSNDQTHLNFPILTKWQCIENPSRKDLMQLISFYYYKKEKQELDNVDKKIQDILMKSVSSYYFLLDYFSSKISDIEQHVINSRDTSIEDKVSTFESQLDNFFEYAIKKTQTNQPDMLQEVKQYFDESIVNKTTNVLE